MPKLTVEGFGTFEIRPGAETERAVGLALEAGYRHIDTAQGYGNERSAGRALRESGLHREDVFLTTKLTPGVRVGDPVAAAERSAIYPDAPTLREQGFPNVVASGWFGFMAPSAVPQPIVGRMQAEIIRALADAEVKQKLLAQGLEARAGTAADFGKFIDDETRKWGDLIRATGLKGE